jgi:hypothetical protein
MCYDKCVKFNQSQNFEVHLWNLSFNTVIMGIILYWRVFHYSQVKWAVNFTLSWFLFFELNNLEEYEIEQYMRKFNAVILYKITYILTCLTFLVLTDNIEVHLKTAKSFKWRGTHRYRFNLISAVTSTSLQYIMDWLLHRNQNKTAETL